MPKLLLVTAPTDEVRSQKDETKVLFPGTEKAIERLTEAGWEVHTCGVDWPEPLAKAEEVSPDAVLVSTYKRVPRARDCASMFARQSDIPVYTIGVMQKDEAFRTMAPTVGVLRNIGELPLPE